MKTKGGVNKFVRWEFRGPRLYFRERPVCANRRECEGGGVATARDPQQWTETFKQGGWTYFSQSGLKIRTGTEASRTGTETEMDWTGMNLSDPRK